MNRTILLVRKPFGVPSIHRLTRKTACFHNCSQLRSSSDTSYRSLSQDPTARSSPRQVSFYARDASSTNHQDVLMALQAFHESSEVETAESETEAKAVVILATPALAQWLEDGSGFIKEVLHSLNKKSPSSSGFRREIDVVCACVDGLSPQPPRISHERGKAPLEGFAFLYGKRDLILPNWNDEESHSSQESTLQSSITFSDAASANPFEITLPLATTLFTNGRHSTLLVSKWWQDSEESFAKTKGPVGRRNVHVQISQSGLEREPQSYVPSVILTPARQIVSGLGNIIRRLDFGDAGVGPASQELETVVAAELKGQPDTKTKIDIWALIVPPQVIEEGAEDYFALTTNRDMVYDRKATSGRPDYPYVGHWLSKGAILCRVLSGGGGWGAKQGLLSLDPQTTYEMIDEARFDFSEGSLEDQQASALGTLAKEGHYVQFFTAKLKYLNRKWHKNNLKNGYNKKRDDEYARDVTSSTVIGTTPSTRDQLPVSEEPRSIEAKDRKGLISTRPGHFGCVTESGLFLRRKSEETGTWVTKVDLPYSYLFFHDGGSTIRLYDPFGSPKYLRTRD